MKRTLIATALAFAISGCATIVGSTTQSVTIKSVPEGANISITNRAGEKIHTGMTPATITLKKSAGYFKAESYTVKFQKDGYEAKELIVSGQVNGWYFGNIIFGGLIVGMLIVDPMTGAMFSLSPDTIDAGLDAVGAKTSKADGSLTVVLLEDVPAELMQHARRLN
ncbi:hypothetical protein [Dechloromonas hortensis]|uniref:hypothetical protein n=1 Tax=Dechloromonas hortensis TaxID=337779 RepID=UPI001292A24B|nr:hypothetical protein [Dechloromonas hortensis]